MIILIILGYILLFLFLILTVVLIIPIEYSVYGQKYEQMFIKVESFWLFKAIQVFFCKHGGEKPQFLFKIFGFTFIPKKKQRYEKEKKKKKSKKPKRFFNRDILDQLLKSIRQLLVYLKPKVFDIDCVFGFDDPYHTGLACAVINTIPVYGKDINIRLSPIFDEEIFEGKFHIQGRIVLAVIAWIAIKFILSPPVRNKLIKERKRKVYVTQC